MQPIGCIVSASDVMASVQPQQTWIASGTNSALSELGLVFGVAVLAAGRLPGSS